MCGGSEPGLFNCTYDLNHNCGHANDAGVRCVTSESTGYYNYTLLPFINNSIVNVLIGCMDGAIRLAGSGSSSTQGRVEVCSNNQWGTVCDDTWNSLDASVACFHLGYSNEGNNFASIHTICCWMT